jgi:hypothetical protein
MRLLLFAAALAVAPAAFAQTSFGVTVGVNAANVGFSDFAFDEVDGVSKLARLGLTAGAFADLPLSGSLSFHPELAYAQRGYKVDFEIPGAGKTGGFAEGSITAKADYLELPLLLAYHVRGATGLDVAVEAGPSLAFKLSESSSCSSELSALCAANDEDDDLKSLDVAVAGGVSVSAGPYGFGIRYTNSIPSILKDDPDVAGDETARHQVLSAFARYRFGG